jgi:hypothetical protein
VSGRASASSPARPCSASCRPRRTRRCMHDPPTLSVVPEPRRPPHPAAPERRLHPAEPLHDGLPRRRLLLDHLHARRALPHGGVHDPAGAALRHARRPHRALHALDELVRRPVRFAGRPDRVRRRAGLPRLHVGADAVGPLGLARRDGLRRVRGAPLARFNVQVGTVEKRHFLGLPSPAAADVVATTCCSSTISAARTRRRSTC